MRGHHEIGKAVLMALCLLALGTSTCKAMDDQTATATDGEVEQLPYYSFLARHHEQIPRPGNEQEMFMEQLGVELFQQAIADTTDDEENRAGFAKLVVTTCRSTIDSLIKNTLQLGMLEHISPGVHRGMVDAAITYALTPVVDYLCFTEREQEFEDEEESDAYVFGATCTSEHLWDLVMQLAKKRILTEAVFHEAWLDALQVIPESLKVDNFAFFTRLIQTIVRHCDLNTIGLITKILSAAIEPDLLGTIVDWPQLELFHQRCKWTLAPFDAESLDSESMVKLGDIDKEAKEGRVSLHSWTVKYNKRPTDSWEFTAEQYPNPLFPVLVSAISNKFADDGTGDVECGKSSKEECLTTQEKGRDESNKYTEEAQQDEQDIHEADSMPSIPLCRDVFDHVDMRNKTRLKEQVLEGLPLFFTHLPKKMRKMQRLLSREYAASTFSDVSVQISKIPYGTAFGIATGDLTLAEYLEFMDIVHMSDQTVPPSGICKDDFTAGCVFNMCRWFMHQSGAEMPTFAHEPLYVFDGYVLDNALQGVCQMPPAIMEAFETLDDDVQLAIANQLYVGPACTGSPSHFHDEAFNYLAHGQKLWFLSSPAHSPYSRLHPAIDLAIGDTLSLSFGDGAGFPTSCVQKEGELLMVPKDWAHATLNLQETYGCAVELTRMEKILVTPSTSNEQ
eukprot:m.264103 g.264103  ORF g.264103 m.264103 type:complete len:675 (+) comp15609_c2_seq4:193-2217(+)